MSRRHSPGPLGSWWHDERDTPEGIRFTIPDVAEASTTRPPYIHMMELEPGVDLYAPLDTHAWFTRGPDFQVVELAEELEPYMTTVEDFVSDLYKGL